MQAPLHNSPNATPETCEPILSENTCEVIVRRKCSSPNGIKSHLWVHIYHSDSIYDRYIVDEVPSFQVLLAFLACFSLRISLPILLTPSK